MFLTQIVKHFVPNRVEQTSRKESFSENQNRPCDTHEAHCLNYQVDWQLNEQVFYLLDTIKVRYESSFGRVTLENIDVETLLECIDELKKALFPIVRITLLHRYSLRRVGLLGKIWKHALCAL